jgi:hypothetical protein
MEERHRFLTEQLDDLKRTRDDLLDIIKEVDSRVEQVFTEAYAEIEREFEGVFSRLFPGGEGRLILTDPSDMLNTGVDVEARPPGKKVKRLSLLSGGERSLTAVAFLVALFKARPSPFYVLDEVEAALEDVNLGRLIDIIEELRDTSQLIVITHQKRTMEIADALYGVSMRGDGVTQVIGQRLRETNFDEIAGLAIHENQDRSPGPHEPVEVKNGRLGRSVCATRDIAAGETVLVTWGRQLQKRSRHSMQVDVDTHILPDGVTVLFNHSCEPNCGVIIRAGMKQLEVRALKPIAVAEELTFDYDTFEYEVDHLKGQCLCGAAKCRGRVAGYKHLAADVKARYGEFIADYLRILESEVSTPIGA